MAPTRDRFQAAVDEMRGQRAREIRESWKPPQDPASVELRDASERTTMEIQRASIGHDKDLDEALLSLSRLTLEVEQDLSEAARERARVEAGDRTRQEYQGGIGLLVAQAQRDLQARKEAALERLEAAEARAVDEILPVPARGTTAEVKADLQLAFQGVPGGQDANASLLSVWRRALAARDTDALGLLRSSWGKDLFISRGGTEASWDGLRQQMVQEALAGPFRSHPASKRLEKLRASGRKAVSAQAFRVDTAIQRLREAGNR